MLHPSNQALLIAAEDGMLDIVQMALKNGASVFTKDIYTGNTPLHWAAGHGNSAMVQLLLSYNACVHMKNNQGDTALALCQNVICNEDFASSPDELLDYQAVVALLRQAEAQR